jgi:hypothetical protein
LRWYKRAIKANSVTTLAIKVASAEPAIPKPCHDPTPNINRGLRAMSSPTETIKNKKGVFESPAPRRMAIT